MKSLILDTQEVVLALVLVASAVVFAIVDLRVPETGFPIARDYESIRATDPYYGTVVDLSFLSPPPPPQLSSQHKIFVLLMGDCASCSKYSVKPAKFRVGSSADIFFVFSGKIIEKDVAKYRKIGRVFSDVKGRLADKLNMAWSPRGYLLDSDHRLTWIAPIPGDFPPEVRYE